MGAPRPGRPPRGRAPVTPARAGGRAPPGPGAPPGRVPLFTFFGLDAIHAERHEHIKIATVGNPGFDLATWAGGIPGVSTALHHHRRRPLPDGRPAANDPGRNSPAAGDSGRWGAGRAMEGTRRG